MRTVIVILMAEGIKSSLLCTQGCLGRRSRLGFERPMHAFMTAILSRDSRSNSLRDNTQSEEPNRYQGESADGRRRKGRTIITSDSLRQTIRAV